MKRKQNVKKTSFDFRSLCQDQTSGFQGKENWQEKEDYSEECQPQSLLQRIICLHG